MAKTGIKVIRSNPSWITELKKRIGKPEYKVSVGLPKESDESGVAYPDGTPLLEVAFYNEFGTETIPARPAIKIGARKASKKLGPKLKKIIQEINDKKKLKVQLGLIGAEAVGVIQSTITSLKAPPNAASTVRQKGSSNPLVDTGLYRQSITWEIKES